MTNQSTDGTDHEEYCHYCSRNYPESKLTPVMTVVNGVEGKEWVCPSCEPAARENEKSPEQSSTENQQEASR